MEIVRRTSIAIPALLILAVAGSITTSAAEDDTAAGSRGEVVHLTLMPSGIMRKLSRYMPRSIELSAERPASLSKPPQDLKAPLYGQLPIGYPAHEGDQQPTVLVVIDEPEGKDARLFIDTNRNGDMTDDPATQWVNRRYEDEGKQYRQYRGSGSVNIADAAHPANVSVVFERYDGRDPKRTPLMNSLFYFRDYAYQGDITLAGKSYQSMLVDEKTSGDFRGNQTGTGVQLLLDINANGKFDNQGESFNVREPFNIAGVTYEIADMRADGSEFRIVKSSKTVAEIPTPPPPADHQVGKPITAFEATLMDGTSVKFPSDYKGKIVMIDFWATWCHPCIMEVPGVVKAYEAFHNKGFEILGITLDSADAVEKINAVVERNHMTWPEVYDGEGWNSRIAQLYTIHSIPQAYLVDGDSGEVLAAGGTLRGDNLIGAIESALARKAKPDTK